MPLRISLLVLFVFSTGVIFVAGHVQFLAIPGYALGATETAFAEKEELGRILFVGDILLGRGVEMYMESKGPAYPFERISEFTRSYDLTVGNFEASVPKEHKHTPDLDLQFSVRQEYLAQLNRSGFDVLSLANNHALDHGEDGYKHTHSACVFYNMTCFGHPNTLDLYSVYYHDLDDTRIGILALNTTLDDIDDISLGALLGKMSFYSDLQIVFVHWGNEYEKMHSVSQQKLAYTLIDNGVDAVVGHHPHVVQDIEFYKEKPIFYSLGNFIFDQYFDTDVQKGLAVSMRVSEEKLAYRLYGITSVNSQSQPRLMNAEENTAFLGRLSVTADDSAFGESVRRGAFTLSW